MRGSICATSARFMSLARNSLIASACIFLCRMTGMAREAVYNGLFGLGGPLDAFNTAFRLPNLLRDLFAEGALSQAYTSVASKVKKADGDSVLWELTSKVATQLSSMMVAIVTLGIVFAGPLMGSLYHGSTEGSDMDMAIGLCRLMWPFIAFASLSALVMGALNVVGVFGLPMLASAAFNVVSIMVGFAIGYWIDPTFGLDGKALYGFAIGVTLGGVAQWLVQVPRLRREGFRWKLNFNWKDKNLYKIWGLMLPSVMASGVTQFNVYINTGFALELKAGSVSALSTAFKLWQLPVGLFGVATGMVVLPAVSRLIGDEDGKGKVAEHVATALRLVALFAVPSVVVLAILGENAVSVVYQWAWGHFGEADVIRTGDVLVAYAWGLLGYAGTKVVQPVFLALEKRWVPLMAALVALSLSYSCNYTFVRILHKDASWLALTTSVITTFNFLFYFLYLRRQLGGICGGVLFSGLIRIVFAGVLLAVWCWAAKTFFMQDFLEWGHIFRIFTLSLVCGGGALLYLAAVWVLKLPEFEQFRDKFMKNKS
ncbi:murein biosynthesis integral membrane protein MurJ [Akkermansia sp. N21116]|uniref:murein biosynthesis integral membrane protein MurJ n=1 Tax=Akkermansia sp. N21116 TaxID=3040764 RepID=UPI00244EE458|nr:murein biosynthesis integral membrane protein MurJ [Akkermansia sp. N21116]WPX39881.1 murein biosynthesis integral membrane protein MurJ [Akkermansia sp. N21116]